MLTPKKERNLFNHVIIHEIGHYGTILSGAGINNDQYDDNEDGYKSERAFDGTDSKNDEVGKTSAETLWRWN